MTGKDEKETHKTYEYNHQNDEQSLNKTIATSDSENT